MTTNPFPSTGEKNYMSKLSVTDMYNNFKDYNFIISTSEGVFDTSNYNLCQRKSLDIGTTLGSTSTLISGGNIDLLILAYNSSTNIGEDPKPLSHTGITTKDRFVIIPEKTVIDIKVKSKRGFMKNQSNAKKI